MRIKLLNKFKSFFFKKLIFSFALIVFMTVSVIGLTSYKYISNQFNKQIIRFNTELLDRLKKTVDKDIFEKATFLSLDILFKNTKSESIHFFLDNPVSDNYRRIPSVISSLNDIEFANNQVIDSIYVYYKNNKFIISSKSGIKFTDDINIMTQYDSDWINLFNNSNLDSNSLWLRTRKPSSYSDNPGSNNVISLIRPLPLNAGKDDYQGLFAININELTLRNSMMNTTLDNFDEVFIVDSDGNIISHKNPSYLYTNIKDKPYFRNIIESANKNVLTQVNNVETVISSTKSDFTDWYYVYMLPAEQYYQKTFLIRQIILIICLMTLFLALLLSNIFSFNLVNPFLKIAASSRSILGALSNDSHDYRNEAKIIDSTINVLSSKVTDLEKIVDKNRKMISHTFYLNMLNDDAIYKDEEIKQMLDFISAGFGLPYFSVIMLQFNTKVINNSSIEEGQFLMYNLIEEIENLSIPIKPIVLDKYHIAIILNHSNFSDREAIEIIQLLNDLIINMYNIPTKFSIGNPTKDIGQINLSYKEAKSAMQYSCIHNDITVFNCMETVNWDSNNDFNMDKLDTISKFLKTTNFEKVKDLLHSIRNDIIAKHISYSLYNKIIDIIIISVERAIESMNVDTSIIIDRPVSVIIHENYYIDDVFLCIEKICNSVIDNAKAKNDNINELYISKAKEYILQNLDQDLSLESVAQKLFISREYLCRIFKDITCENFVDYITSLRMEKAKELLVMESTPASVIAQMVGFNNYSYFTKKFKEYYGNTPNRYRKTDWRG